MESEDNDLLFGDSDQDTMNDGVDVQRPIDEDIESKDNNLLFSNSN